MLHSQFELACIADALGGIDKLLSNFEAMHALHALPDATVTMRPAAEGPSDPLGLEADPSGCMPGAMLAGGAWFAGLGAWTYWRGTRSAVAGDQVCPSGHRPPDFFCHQSNPCSPHSSSHHTDSYRLDQLKSRWSERRTECPLEVLNAIICDKQKRGPAEPSR